MMIKEELTPPIKNKELSTSVLEEVKDIYEPIYDVPDETSKNDIIQVPQSSTYIENSAHWQIFRRHRVKQPKKKMEMIAHRGTIKIKEMKKHVKDELKKTILREKSLPIHKRSKTMK